MISATHLKALRADNPAWSALPASRLVRITGLNPGLCKWPIGEVRAPGFRYCGADCPPGLVYCPSHKAVSVARASAEAAE